MIKAYPMIFFIIIAIGMLFTLTLIDPIAQDVTYHLFADTKEIYYLPNFWNVVSNISFFYVGIYGISQLIILKNLVIEKTIKQCYMMLFIAIVFVAFGSAYYHLHPNNQTLIWDRLPMTLVFMTLCSILISEFISIKKGLLLFYPLLLLGILSVLYWGYTESLGEGDLRPYIFIQFYPILMLPIILTQFSSLFTLEQEYWYLFGCYALAKICEIYDKPIYDFLEVISGHSLKHIIAGVGLYLLVRMFIKREKKASKDEK